MSSGPSQPPLSSPPRVDILGVAISAINIPVALAALDGWIARCERDYVCVAAVHSVMACRRDPALRQVFNSSGMTTPDGMPLVWLSRFAGHHHVERVYGPDLMLAACSHGVASGVRHFMYGGAPGVPEELRERLLTRFPGLKIVGAISPPYGEISEAEQVELNKEINDARPDIVWIGLGTGTQEHWMARNRPSLAAPVLIGVGAAFDFLSGRKPQAPRWMQRSGLEWLFRFACEPGRLWPRYREYPIFVLLILGQLLHLRKYPMED